jgi:hypothetical protein
LESILLNRNATQTHKALRRNKEKAMYIMSTLGHSFISAV